MTWSRNEGRSPGGLSASFSLPWEAEETRDIFEVVSSPRINHLFLFGSPSCETNSKDLPDECPGVWACDQGLKRPLRCYEDSGAPRSVRGGVETRNAPWRK